MSTIPCPSSSVSSNSILVQGALMAAVQQVWKSAGASNRRDEQDEDAQRFGLADRDCDKAADDDTGQQSKQGESNPP